MKAKHRIIGLLLTLALLASVLPISALAEAAPWYGDALSWAEAKGISDASADPNADVTRAEAVTLLWKTAGEPAAKSESQPFADVEAGSGYESAVLWAYENGITYGTSTDTFSPSQPVTRSQMVTLFYRYIQHLGGGFEGLWAFPLDYADAADVPEYAYEAFCYTTMKGIVNGINGSLAPSAACSMAEAVSLLYRYTGDRSVACGIYSINKYGNVILNIYAETLNEAGFEAGDIVSVLIGDNSYEMPYGTNYSDVNPGYMTLTEKNNSLILSINQRSFAEEVGLDESSVGAPVVITMSEKAGYLRQYQARSMIYSNERGDYDSDEAFSNFRAVHMGNIGEKVLYRSASGIDNATGRAATTSALYEGHGIKTVVNLADSAETIESLIAGEAFDAAYYKTLYENGAVVTSGALGIDFSTETFKAQLTADLREMTAHEAPYAIHCLEGKDRTGFVIVLLEALMGASYEDMLDDYMLSYVNYYHIEKGSEQYEIIKQSNADYLFLTLAGLDHVSELESADYEKAAVDYLTEAGMTEFEIAALKSCLAGNR